VQFSRPDQTTVVLSHLDPLLADLLRRVPPSADPGDSASARARLFSPPSHDDEETDLLEDWQEYVAPELARLFRSSIEVIETDLRRLHVDPKDGNASLSIGFDHLESWVHGLNQARLALVARHDFSEAEMEEFLPLTGGERPLALLHVRFYGILQELFLRELEGN
jgi:hypothetical protein